MGLERPRRARTPEPARPPVAPRRRSGHRGRRGTAAGVPRLRDLRASDPLASPAPVVLMRALPCGLAQRVDGAAPCGKGRAHAHVGPVARIARGRRGSLLPRRQPGVERVRRGARVGPRDRLGSDGDRWSEPRSRARAAALDRSLRGRNGDVWGSGGHPPAPARGRERRRYHLSDGGRRKRGGRRPACRDAGRRPRMARGSGRRARIRGASGGLRGVAQSSQPWSSRSMTPVSAAMWASSSLRQGM